MVFGIYIVYYSANRESRDYYTALQSILGIYAYKTAFYKYT